MSLAVWVSTFNPSTGRSLSSGLQYQDSPDYTDKPSLEKTKLKKKKKRERDRERKMGRKGGRGEEREEERKEKRRRGRGGNERRGEDTWMAILRTQEERDPLNLIEDK